VVVQAGVPGEAAKNQLTEVGQLAVPSLTIVMAVRTWIDAPDIERIKSTVYAGDWTAERSASRSAGSSTLPTLVWDWDRTPLGRHQKSIRPKIAKTRTFLISLSPFFVVG
jgi:hypothetical protein